MKISYRTHPALEFLEQDGRHVGMLVDEKDEVDYQLIQTFFMPKLSGFINGLDRSNIIKPSKSFLQASWEATKKTVFSNELEFVDVLVGKSGVLLLPERTTFYSIKKTPGGNIVVEFIGFDNQHNTLLEFGLQNGETVNKQAIWFSKCLNFETLPETLQSKQAYYLYLKYLIIAVLLFKKYAEVETKELPAGKKVKGIECKYINETKVNVTYLDSTWFTNLVKSEGFDVRGHFRFQPCGAGMKDRKIIWINPFHKTGYTAPARKLKEEAE